MIKIFIKKTKQKFIEIKIFGHAKSNKYNKDLICAAITGIVTGGLNAINKIKPNSCKFIINEGLVFIIVIKNSFDLQIILQTLYYQFLTIYQQNQKFINIKEIKK